MRSWWPLKGQPRWQRGGADEAQDAVVVDQDHDQAGQTDAIGATGATTSTAISPFLPIVGEQKRILRWPMARQVLILIAVMIVL